MGCGASAGGGGGRPSSTPAKYKEEAEQDGTSSKSAKAKAKKKPVKKKAAEAKDIEWHNKNCSDGQFELVRTVRQAYPFNDSKKKTIHKKEQVRSGGVDDLFHQDDWGKVEISDIGPTRLLCDMCGVLMVDLYTKPEAPFYVCRNCQRHDRKLELCVRCFTTKAHHEAEDPGSPKGKGKGGFRSPTGVRSQPMRGQTAKLGVGSETTSYGSETGTGTASLEDCLKGLPTGKWEGHFQEEGGKRRVAYELKFSGSGIVEGRGPNGCELEGRFSWNIKTYRPSVEWKENHDWGTLDFHADVDPAAKELEGSFTVSDGGRGTARLQFVKIAE